MSAIILNSISDSELRLTVVGTKSEISLLIELFTVGFKPKFIGDILIFFLTLVLIIIQKI